VPLHWDLLARKLWLSSELEVGIEKKELEFEQGPPPQGLAPDWRTVW
jgi:hypothetical protein